MSRDFIEVRPTIIDDFEDELESLQGNNVAAFMTSETTVRSTLYYRLRSSDNSMRSINQLLWKGT